jgi:glycosyltransferase involved in cell wall biosynthesis
MSNANILTRTYWAQLACRTAEPVLLAMSKKELKKSMPLELSPIWDGRDKNVAYLEAFGRLTAGIAPWLALPDDDTEEGRQRKYLRELTLICLANAVDPDNPDYMEWHKETQPLVDAAHLVNGFLRAPNTLWEPLDELSKQRFIKELKGLRRIKPFRSNWLLFGAMIETFLLSIGEDYDSERIYPALQQIEKWYVGDGWYSDGYKFAFDYYNSFVIHPMYVEILEVLVKHNKIDAEDFYIALQRMRRYATILERLISPEGAFPAFGRSITYRMAVFQPLALLAWKYGLPQTLSYGQVCSSLTAVMKRLFAFDDIFNSSGFLQLGFAGHQPEIADYYTNTGSLYITSLVFLPLGLPANHPFWTEKTEMSTAEKAWNGKTFLKDGAFVDSRVCRLIENTSVIKEFKHDAPLISVVIPTYNTTNEVLKTTLHSVLNQTYQNIEIWLIDDGSETDTSALLKEINDQRIHYHKLPRANANVARNYGIVQSKGKYIAMLDSDDSWLVNHLENCITTLQNTNADGLYGSLIVRNKSGREQLFYARHLGENETMINYLLTAGCGAQTSTLFLTAESAKDILWDSKLNRHQDYDFVVRYSKKYQLIPKEKATVIYNFDSTGKMIDFKSCIRFINSNINDIEPQLYHSYNYNMLLKARNKKAGKDIINHYVRESTRYKSYMPYYRYVTIRYPENWLERLKCKFEYLFHILLVKVECEN